MHVHAVEAAIEVVDLALAAQFGFEIVKAAGKKNNPLTPRGFDAVVIGIMRDLQGAAEGPEKQAVDAFLRKVDVDFERMTPKQRSETIIAAGRDYLGITRGVAPEVRKAMMVNGKVVIESMKGATADQYGLKIDPSFTLVDKAAVEAAATRQAHFCKDQYGRRSATMSATARQVVSSGIERGLDRFDIAKELAGAIPQAARTDAYWQVVASAFIGRSRTWSMLSSFEEAGISRYQWESVLDEVTTEMCRFMHGKIFDVASAIERHLQVDGNDDPEAVKDLQPWAYSAKTPDGQQGLFFKSGGERQMIAQVDKPGFGSKDAVGQYSNAMSGKALSAAGMQVPPVHGHCRSLIVPIESEVVARPSRERPAAPTPPPAIARPPATQPRAPIAPAAPEPPLVQYPGSGPTLGEEIPAELQPATSIAPVPATPAPAPKPERRRPSATVQEPAGPPPAAEHFDLQLKGKAQTARVEKALAAIDKVHTVPAIVPRVPIRTERADTEEAQYVYRRDNGKPLKITMRAQTMQPGLSVLHEIGHMLDHQAHDTPGSFASESPREFAPVIDALKSSRAFKEIESIEKAAIAKLLRQGAPAARIDAVRRQLAYVKDPKEMWARAYSQHIIQRSGDSALVGELAISRGRGPIGSVYLPLQWDDDDFGEIASAIEAYMKKQGWAS